MGGIHGAAVRLSLGKKEWFSVSQKDMTTGPITAQLLIFTLPILLSQLLQQFYNLADTAMVGQLIGADALAAVGTGGLAVICYRELLYWPFRGNQCAGIPAFRRA